jgi:hypothetical protein
MPSNNGNETGNENEKRNEKKNGNLNERDMRLVTWIFGGFFVVGLSVFAVYCFAHLGLNGARSLLWSFALVAVGMAVGFLFGIPRVFQGGGARDVGASPPETTKTDGGSDYAQRVNTNLEEISDWLTKTIVGLGLVELKEIPGQLMRLANVIGDSAGGGNVANSVGLAVVLFFGIGGFLYGYLMTRLYLQGALRRAEAYWKRHIQETVDETIAERQQEIREDVTEVAMAAVMLENYPEQESLPTARTTLPLAERHRLEKTKSKLVEARLKDPTNREIGVLLGRTHDALGELDAAMEVLGDVLEAKKKAGTHGDRDTADLLYNRACYAAVRSVHEKNPALRRKAIEDLKLSFSLDPTGENKEEARTEPYLQLPDVIADPELQQLLQ